MRKKIKIIAVVSVLGVLSILIFGLLSEAKEKATIAKRIHTIPSFTLKNLEDIEFGKDNLRPNTPCVFLYFNSECDFCQHEAESIHNHIDKFNEILLVFVSTEPIEKIKEFSEKYNLHKRLNILFFQDINGRFSEKFNVTTIPFALAYDKHQKLIKTHKGQLNAKGILKFFDKNSYE
jgi:thiol-disulfide isomerase/thioredoxin